jgi:two-component system nitrogen regulation sensor histidine kinase GlnL
MANGTSQANPASGGPSRGSANSPLDPAAILGALPDPVIVVGADSRILYANPAAEQFFAAGAAVLYRHTLEELAPFGSPLLSLVAQVRRDSGNISEHDVDMGTPRVGQRSVDIHLAAVSETPGSVVIRFEHLGVARKIDRQLNYRGGARSVTAMAAVMAHEVKNPLSGIRGAAQLLEQNASEPDRELTRLICDETDRICALVDRMDVFADKRPMARGPVNIHQVLEHVRKLSQSGFARHVRFVEQYDPSLPPVLGNRDMLIQALLNLVKNAAEAVGETGGEILLSTAFRPGVRLAIGGGGGGGDRVRLPLMVSIQDNGPGISDDIMAHLFEPFVTSKAKGTGLGLALVAKIVGDHGGVIECESRPRRTAFHVLLPMDEKSDRPDAAQGAEN